MRRVAFFFLIIFSLFFGGFKTAVAQEEATESAQPLAASESASQQIQQVTRTDITERTSPVKEKLAGYLDTKDPGPLSWRNFLQHAIRQGVSKGVSANTIVLVLLFPVVAGLIAAARHIFGFQGFGIFVPAMLAVALVATGIRVGLILLMIIWLTANLSRRLIHYLKLQYLPRMALLMWFISLGVLAVLLGAVQVDVLSSLSAASIFPILILMLLTENFIEAQTGKSRHEAADLIWQTLILAVVLAVMLRLDFVQRLVILNPEIVLLSTAVFDVFVGKYVGLRLMEWVKFRKLTK
jgi:hypothetical protein